MSAQQWMSLDRHPYPEATIGGLARASHITEEGVTPIMGTLTGCTAGQVMFTHPTGCPEWKRGIISATVDDVDVHPVTVMVPRPPVETDGFAYRRTLGRWVRDTLTRITHW